MLYSRQDLRRRLRGVHWRDTEAGLQNQGHERQKHGRRRQYRHVSDPSAKRGGLLEGDQEYMHQVMSVSTSKSSPNQCTRRRLAWASPETYPEEHT